MLQQTITTPTSGREFWLSDYIYEKRQTQGKITDRLGMARRMPRINKVHEKLFQDTLKILSKQGQSKRISISFQQKYGKLNKSQCSHYNLSPILNKNHSYSPDISIQKGPINKFKRISQSLIQKIKTQTDNKQQFSPEKQEGRYYKIREKMSFDMKSSDQWIKTQQQILKINVKSHLIRLQKRRLKKIHLGIDRSSQQLINQLKGK